MILSSIRPSVPCHSLPNRHWIDGHFKSLLSTQHLPGQNCPWSATKCVYLRETTQPSSSPPQNDRNVGTNCLSSWSTLLPHTHTPTPSWADISRLSGDVCAVSFRVDCTPRQVRRAGLKCSTDAGVCPCLRAEFLQEVNFWEPGWDRGWVWRKEMVQYTAFGMFGRKEGRFKNRWGKDSICLM